MERLRDWWEHLAPRERRLFTILGVTALLCVFGFVGMRINDGLNALERDNAATREALKTIDAHRDDLAERSSQASEVVAVIGDEAPSLATYLETIEGEVGVQIRNSSERPVLPKGKFREHALQVTLYNVTLSELTEFLRKIETKSPSVVTQRVYVKRSSTQPDHMDRVEITVATWDRKKSDAKPDVKAGADGGAPVKPNGEAGANP